MGPQSKKRKLQQPPAGTSATAASKRPKKQHSSSKAAKSKAPRGKVVEAASLAWNTVDEEEFGGLQIIEGVDVVKDGNKVQFVVSGEQKPQSQQPSTEDTKDDEDDSFEGFGDDPVEGQDVHPGEAGGDENGLETAGAQDETPAQKDNKASDDKQKKKSKKQQKQQSVDDGKLAQGRTKEGGNAFGALADDGGAAEERRELKNIDVDAWKALNVSPAMLAAVAKLKFRKPTEIQAQTVPQILNGEDVIGKAQTGSGKTLAFGIPIVERWLEMADAGDAEKKKEGPLALVLSPTRELAKQLGDHLKALCDGLPSGPYVCVITGGLSIQKQQRQLEKADIVIATPGRLWEVLEGDANLQESFTKIQFLVVDEADRLFKAGQFKEAEDIIGVLDRRDPEAESDEEDEDSEDDEDLSPRQTLVFSATFDKDLQTKLAGKGKRKWKGADGDEDKMAYLMKCLRFRQEPKFIDVNPVRQMAEGLKEGLVECGPMEKDLFLYTVLLLNPKRRTLVFANSISAVRRLTPFLTNLNIDATALHSQMPQKARLRSLEKFSAASSSQKKKPGATPGNKSCVLVATDVAARGLDIPEVDMVVHYHVPRAADTYVHRSGRTARGGRTGVSVMLCAPDEVLPTRRLAGKVHAESKGGKKEHFIQTLPVDRHISSRLKPRTDLAKRIADSALAKEKIRSDESFMRNAADELGVEYDSDVEEAAGKGWNGGRGGGRKRKEKQASEMTKAELGIMRAKLREELSKRVNLGVSERYIAGGRVDVGALLKEREQGGGTAGLFLGGEGLGLSLGFD